MRVAVAGFALLYFGAFSTSAQTTDPPSFRVHIDPIARVAPDSLVIMASGYTGSPAFSYIAVHISVNGQEVGFAWAGTLKDEPARLDYRFVYPLDAPGHYTVSVFWVYSYGVIVDAVGWELDVGSPWYGILVEKPGNRVVRLSAPDAVRSRWITESAIDWGDGLSSSVQWGPAGPLGAWVEHQYAVDGTYTVTWINSYHVNSTTFTSAVPVTFSTDVVTPVESTTWGRVKALYRK